MSLQEKLKAKYAKAKAEQPTTHKLGALTGTIYEFPDGSASYREPAGLQPEFHVMISEITGFAFVTEGLTSELRVLGHGTTLATVANVTPAGYAKIERWFRSHPLFRTAAHPTMSQAASTSTADELRKLADLRAAGILSEDEFAAQKAKLLE